MSAPFSEDQQSVGLLTFKQVRSGFKQSTNQYFLIKK